MSRIISYHNVTAVEVTNIQDFSHSTSSKPFYSRHLIIKMADGTTEDIGLFCENGYNLLIVDADLDSLTTELPLLKAA